MLLSNMASLKKVPKAIFAFLYYRKVIPHKANPNKIADSSLHTHEENNPISLRLPRKDDSLNLSSLKDKDTGNVSLPENDDIFYAPSKYDITTDCLNSFLNYISTTPTNPDILKQHCEVTLPDPSNQTTINNCSKALLQIFEEKASLNQTPHRLKSYNLYLETTRAMEIFEDNIDALNHMPEMSNTVEKMKTILHIITNQAHLCEIELTKEHRFDIVIKEYSEQNDRNIFKQNEDLIKLIGSTTNTEKEFNNDLVRNGIAYDLLGKDGNTISSVQEKDYSVITAADDNNRAAKYANLNTTLCNQIKSFTETYPKDQSEFLYRFLLSITTQGAYAPSITLLSTEMLEHQDSIDNNFYMLQVGQTDRKCNVEILQMDNNNIKITVSAAFQLRAVAMYGSSESIKQIKTVNTEMSCEYDCNSKPTNNEDRIKLRHINIQDK